jgi:XTP/dITP diphosphohydrolase
MKIVLATSNQGKVKEIQAIYEGVEVIPYSEVITPFHIEETGTTFQENALIKAHAVYEALGDENAVVLSDDSGIGVDVLDGAPGIYSARYAGVDASDIKNLEKLIESLRLQGADTSKAHYTAAIAIVSKEGAFTVHGWMHGRVITKPRGSGGFGYDPMFIPNGFEKTLGELDETVKKEISHRSQALKNAKAVLEVLMKSKHQE